MSIVWTIITFIGIIIIGWMLYALPATFSLKRGTRVGIKRLNIDKAIEELKVTKSTGFELIEKCRLLIVTRMRYNRRNSFASHKTAFRRGYGYCQQQAFALRYILTRLGFSARVVYTVRARFSNRVTGGHAWVRVSYGGTTKDIDLTDIDLTSDKISFMPLTKVRCYTWFSRLLAGWGSIAVNAHRYYKSGKDI